MPVRSGYIPTPEELDRLAEITLSDIADARASCNARVPSMRPAWNADLVEPENDPGPIPDPSP